MEDLSKLLDYEKVLTSKLRSEVSSLSDNMGSRNQDYQQLANLKK